MPHFISSSPAAHQGQTILILGAPDGLPREWSALHDRNQLSGFHPLLPRSLPEVLPHLNHPAPQAIFLVLDPDAPASLRASLAAITRRFLDDSDVHTPLILSSSTDTSLPASLNEHRPLLWFAPPFQADQLMEAHQWLERLEATQNAVLSIAAAHLDNATRLSVALSDLTSTVHPVAMDPRQTHHFLQYLESLRPDLLLFHTDLGVPHLISILRHLQICPLLHDLPLLIAGSAPDDSDIAALYRAGADLLVCTPPDFETLKAAMQTRLMKSLRLRRRANRCPLTGLLTRRAFTERFTAQRSLACRHHQPLSLCILDIDHFKRINDRFGHQTGDHVLRRLGELLGDTFRAEDLVARWGGEEFVLSLTGVDIHQARKALERLRSALQNTSFIAPDDSRFTITFSAGITQYDGDALDLTSLLRRADASLLIAKGEGRDRIVDMNDSSRPACSQYSPS